MSKSQAALLVWHSVPGISTQLKHQIKKGSLCVPLAPPLKMLIRLLKNMFFSLNFEFV